MKKTVELIVPCYDEEDCIRLFYDAAADVFENELKEYELRLLFVDDGSSDGTLDAVKALQKDSRVHYISLSCNQGKEAAIYAGLEYSRGDYVAVMDADLQHPPALLKEMLKAVTEEGYDSAAAKRQTRKGEGVIKRAGSVLYYAIVNRMTSIRLVPGSTDFRLMSRQMTDAVLKLSERERFTKGIFQWVGFKTKWIGYENTPRVAGHSGWKLGGLFQYALAGLFSFAKHPLRFAVWCGALGVIASLIYLAVMLAGAEADTESLILFFVIFFGGFLLAVCGFIGEYLARIYMEVKRRPIYIIRESDITKGE
ncbi:MAG: glycosyltransferase [Lachnospiraceae bacterium]|nr:glycosyltransferase [Lachnospiraceae bacterium]